MHFRRVSLSLLEIWNRTFTVSNGWATKVATIPATDPDNISTVHLLRLSFLLEDVDASEGVVEKFCCKVDVVVAPVCVIKLLAFINL